MTTLKQICEELDIHFGRIEQVWPELKSIMPPTFQTTFPVNYLLQMVKLLNL